MREKVTPGFEELKQQVKQLENEAEKRKQIQQDLRAREEKHRAILENIEDCYLEVDLSGNFLDFNNSFCELLGCSEDELHGKNYRAFVDTANAKKLYHIFNNVYETGKPVTGVAWEFIRKDRTKRYGEASISPAKDDAGKCIGFLGIGRDITDCRKAELELFDTKNLWEGAFNAIPDLIAVIDKDHRIVRVNKAMTKRLGITRNMVIGQTCYQIIHGTNEPPNFCPHSQLLTDGQEHSMEVFAERLGGDFRVTVSPIILKNGEMGSIHVARDITKRKQAETALRENQRKYQNIIEKSDDIIWTTDLDVNTMYVSPSIEKKLGFTPEERMPQRLEEQMPSTSYKTVMEHFTRELERENDENVDPDRIIRMEVEYYHKNGSTLWFENIASGIRDEKGTLIGIHGISRDINDKKLADEKLLERENKYRQLFTTVSDAIVLFDPDTKKIIDMNDAAMAMYGYDKKEFLKLPIEKISAEPTESKKSIMETLAGKLIHIPLRYHKKKNGTIFPVEISANPLMLDNRMTICAVIRDITEQKKGEEELKSREKTLQDQAKRLEEVNSALNLLLHRRDEEKKQIEANVLENIKKTVFPYIEKAGKLKIGGEVDTYLEIIKSNLEDIVSPFVKKLSSNYVGLTLKEIQIADLIKNGKSSKEIAEMLKISRNAITVHRHHIRKKLNILNKKVNLTTYLQSLGD